MIVGDKVVITRNIWSPDAHDGVDTDIDARVIYIHPERRFFTVEYVIFGVTQRESFPFRHRSGTAEPEPRYRQWRDWGHRMIESEKTRKERLQHAKEK